MHKITTLKNKLKIITNYMPSSHGVTTGIFVGTGSRYESDKIAGISHILEHMFFKGTKKRPMPEDIARSIEGIGGYANAATSQDYTFYYNRVPKGKAAQGLEVLSDMMRNSIFDDDALEREKNVILEELNMYLDTPSRYIYDLLMHTMWPDDSLGRDVIGTPASIKQIGRNDLLEYIKSNYGPQDKILSIAGNFKSANILALARKYFGGQKPIRQNTFKKTKRFNSEKPRVFIFPKKTDQAHLAIGFPSSFYGHKDEPALALIDVILGTGMSSRLFLKIREEKGLCYSINSFVEKFKDTGLFGVKAGLNIKNIDSAISAILSEVKKITNEKVSGLELRDAKEYLRGNINLSMDNSDSIAAWYGIQGLFYQKIESPQQKIKKLLQVKEDDIIKLARKLFQMRKLSLSVIGPFRKTDEKKFLKLLN
ncbi:MAG: pitrilysin family protein [Candidatus Kuenenbacteria bacterium]